MAASYPDETQRAQRGGLDWPVTKAVAVTPSDSTVIESADCFPRALWIGSGGDLVVDLVESGTSITFKNVASGQLLPVRVKKVKAATTAADIVALY